MPTSTDVLLDLLRPERLTAVVDVGANPIDGDPPYASMLQQRLCTVVGFEPQPTALAELERRRSDLETYLPYVIADGRPHILHMTASSGMTSLLELRDASGVGRGRAGPVPAVDLGLVDPGPQRLDPDPELAGDTLQRAALLARFSPDLEHHPDGPFLQLRRVPSLRRGLLC